jgi:hypothetical protein
MRSLPLTAVVILVAVSAQGSVAAAPAPADPYAALALYDGHWRVTAGAGGKVVDLVNHCARTGLFYACEQVVGGKPVALVVFIPKGESAGGQAYRTQALDAEGAVSHPWYDMTIKGDDWTYAHDGVRDGKPLHERTLNHFTGAGHIHFDVQSSPDGVVWTSQMSGDEERAQ